jgi:hypothetical protein
VRATRGHSSDEGRNGNRREDADRGFQRVFAMQIVVILASAGGDQALIVDPSPAGVATLPGTVIRTEATTPAVQAAVERLFGWLTPILRITTVEVDEDGEPTLVVVELSPTDREPPRGFRWSSQDALALDVAPESIRDTYRWWQHRQPPGSSALDPPWSRPGWFDSTARWMVEQMAALGTHASVSPRLHYLSPISVVLVAPATTGRLFLKCPAPAWAGEARIVTALAERSPGLVPSLAAVEADAGWLLLHDLGDRRLGHEPVGAWAAALVRFADIQQAWSNDLAGLRAAGAPRRPLDALAAAIPPLVEDEAIVSQLSQQQRERVEEAVPRLVAACHRLDELGPPESLVHGDLHPSNIAVTDHGTVVFDWSDAAVAHPFLDLPIFLAASAEVETRRAMMSAYLSCWTDYGGRATVEEAGELALVVGALNYAHAYRALATNLDPHDHLWVNGADALWLRRAVDTLDHGIAMGVPAKQ